MSNERKISDILWEAANVYLRKPGYDVFYNPCIAIFSCNAINLAITNGENQFDSKMEGENFETKKRIVKGLLNMGMQLDQRDYCDFFMHKGLTACGEDTQMARYGWLMFAYEIALEQGV